jgi:hypothetical protein
MNAPKIALGLAFTAVVLAPMNGLAQVSDRELKASYCYGYFKAQSEGRRTLCQSSNVPAEACQSANDDKLKRVLLYLMAKGAFNSGGGGPLIAMTQGRQDFNQCISWLDAGQGEPCFESCRHKAHSADEMMRCAEACEPEVCQKGKTCENLDYLPY